jgi:ABC-type multidrug transport system fused ATPase/permease subunit
MQTLRIFFLLFTKKEKYLYSSIIFLLLANVLLDSVSIALLVPFVSVVLGSNSDLMNQNFLFKNFSFLKDFKLNNYIVFIFFLFLIKNVCQFFIIYIQSKFVQNISTRITSDLYRIYFYQPYSFFLQKFTPEILKNIIESKQFAFSICVI